MFKLLKELAKAPEPLLSASGNHSPYSVHSSDGGDFGSLSYKPRSRAGTLQQAFNAGLGAASGSAGPGAGTKTEDAEETDPDAVKIVRLLAGLKMAKTVMDYVETFSQILTVPGKSETRRSFRRHSGFKLLVQALGDGLAWTPPAEGENPDFVQVKEVQRNEGIRLALEVLAWAQGDRESVTYFERAGGYPTLLKKLYRLSHTSAGPPTANSSPLASSSALPSLSPTLPNTPPTTHQPDKAVLAFLLAHIFHNNYAFLSLLNGSVPVAEIQDKLGTAQLRWPSALPLLLSYTWGLPSVISHTSTVKGKEKASTTRLEALSAAGYFETSEPIHARLIETTFRILSITISKSTSNLFLLHSHLPKLPDFLATRLFGLERKRQYEVTFRPEHDWAPQDDGEEDEPETEWRRPSDSLREVYLVLLRRLLEAGVSSQLTWRLYGLVRREEPLRPHSIAPQRISQTDTPAPTDDSRPTQTTRKGPGALKLEILRDEAGTVERLDAEVLDLIRNAMKSRWPGCFVFDGGSEADVGGLELRDVARPWPKGDKGVHLSTWLYINKLNQAVTLFSCSQAVSKFPFLQVKILENSLISLSTHSKAGPVDAEPEEVVCQAIDALLPHGQWVHFGLNLRHPKGAEIGEARLYVNGVRAGVLRLPYPVTVPPAPGSAPQMGQKSTIPPEAVRLHIGRGPARPFAPLEDSAPAQTGKAEENEWMLGRVLVLEDVLQEDLVLLFYHLGPRYVGNLQEPLGKFLTYSAATSINIYLHGLAQQAKDKRLFAQPVTSVLVKAIRTGAVIAEESVLLSLCAKDAYSLDGPRDPQYCTNGAIPSDARARQLRHGVVRMIGRIQPFAACNIDETTSTVGGGTVILKLIDLANTSDELLSSLTILRDMLQDDWAASEEMERIHGFDLLAAILKPKMGGIVNVSCAKVILSMLGVTAEKSETASVINSVAYRALGTDFELWSAAPSEVVAVYLQHFETLLVTSKNARYNVLRTYQKSAIVKKMLFALRSGFFDAAVVDLAVDTLRIALIARWSAEEAIKPTFSYLITALCQSSPSAGSATEPPPYQQAASLVLATLADVLEDSTRLIKLNRAVALHRLLVIFLSSNSAYYVILPCLRILKTCVTTAGLESFQRLFEDEGGFALLGRTLGPIWRTDIENIVFDSLVDPEQRDGPLLCAAMVPVLTATVESLLSSSGDADDAGRPTHGRTRSGTVTSIKSISITPMVTNGATEEDNRLGPLLTKCTALYRDCAAFRRAMSTKRVESMLPYLADFAAVSGASSKPDIAGHRKALADWLSAIVELARSKLPNSLIEQLGLIREQLTIVHASPIVASPSLPSPDPSSHPRRPSSAGLFGSSGTSKLGPSPSATGFEPLRRRPSTEATLSRMRGNFERRIPLQRTLTGESILEVGKDKNAAWKTIIIQTDQQSHSKMTLERKEHWRRLGQEDWPKQAALLWTENGLWPAEGQPVLWRLDGSEGPLRMRKRLERMNAAPEAGLFKTRARIRDAIPAVDELSSAVSRINMAPWEDPFALALGEGNSISEEAEPAPTLAGVEAEVPISHTPISLETGDDDSFVEVEDNKDDKMKRIAKTLQAGDVVEQAHNIVRIVGVDACPGLLIFGRKNMYLIDSLVYTNEGEVIDAKDAPKDVLSIPSGTLVELDPAEQLSLRWSYTEVVECSKRAFLFRDVALELYFSDKRNFLIVCKDQRERSSVVQKLQSKDERQDAISRSVIGNFVLDTVARATDRSEQQLSIMTRKWQSREISNFAYLQLLNQHANRTPNDVTQYPVFPWVLSDYTSIHLDMSKEATFRDLNLPMGALTPARREAASERYSATEGVGEKPFHYGTHYSSSMIVCGFMIRMSPFTEVFLALQGGNFDLADRLFSSVPRAWESASSDNRGDVRELIPEFFYSTSWVRNINRHDFGKKQGTGETVDDVALPPWALNDPLLFVHRHREALESDYVSRHLAAWIDLTFGYKQRDEASYNCFHPLSYRGAVDLERMQDESEKAASTAIIHNFGQTPLQIFRTPHPGRLISVNSELPLNMRFGVAEQWELLMRSISPIVETQSPIADLYAAGMDEFKPIPLTAYRLAVPGYPALSAQFEYTDDSLRIYYQETMPRMVHIVEGINVAHAVFAQSSLLITASSLGVLTAWRIAVKGVGSRKGEVSLHREGTLRGTSGEVTCLAASKAWSVVVAACNDGLASVWDTNRLRYIRTIQLPRKEAIRLACVHEGDGMIALATAHHIYLYSLNGYPIASAWVEDNALPRFHFGMTSDDAPPPLPEYTGGISFLNREFLRYGALFVIGIGSEVALYRCVPGSQMFEDEQDVKPWSLVEQGRLSRSDEHPGGDCTMVKFAGETLYAAFLPAEGSTKHLLYQWTLPEGHARHVSEVLVHSCMAERCGRHFGLLEPRRFCGGCGGAFCGSHCVHVETMEKRYCDPCRAQLSYAQAAGIMHRRRDSAALSSRRNSLAGSSRPGSRRSSTVGSRRPSFSGHGHPHPPAPPRPSPFSGGMMPAM